ncbi:MAG: hypothetical protein FWD22_06010 [Treponema sp.]|nr:hypothetical protein [Treponema sp.]
MKNRFLFPVLFLLAGVLHAQNTGAFLIPRQIYVGDQATLVLPLPASSQNSDVILTAGTFDTLPLDPYIDFHRIILERRTSGSRLMIEFTAFAAGSLTLPVIEIGGEYFTGLAITVNSILDRRSAPVLSGSALALAMPGTALMLYGSMAMIVIFILLLIWFAFKGKTVLGELWIKWKRRRLFITLMYTERRLYRALQKGIDKRLILDKLSDEFRNFLSILTGINCRAMTAREFKTLPHEHLSIQENNALFLENYFLRCDELRFSGINIEAQYIINLLDDLRFFITTKDKEEKEK